jgi:triphosphatase
LAKDVFCREMLASAEEHGVARSWLDLLRGPAEEERAAAHVRVADELRAPMLTATVLGLAEWGAPNTEAMHIPFVHRTPKLLERLERRVMRRGHHIARSCDEELHALRKALKKLRYSIEFLPPVYRDKQAKAYLRVIKKLLKHLGSLNDAVVVVALAERHGGERQPELAPVRGSASCLGGAAPRQGASPHPKGLAQFQVDGSAAIGRRCYVRQVSTRCTK